MVLYHDSLCNASNNMQKKEINACLVYLEGFETLGGCEGLYGGGGWAIGPGGWGGSCHVL